MHPLKDDGLKQYLQQNDIVWIEKPHSASNFQMENDSKFPNLLYLDPDFDINILLDYVDAVITDYSSVAFDSIKKDIPTILYTQIWIYLLIQMLGFYMIMECILMI